MLTLLIRVLISSIRVYAGLYWLCLYTNHTCTTLYIVFVLYKPCMYTNFIWTTRCYNSYILHIMKQTFSLAFLTYRWISKVIWRFEVSLAQKIKNLPYHFILRIYKKYCTGPIWEAIQIYCMVFKFRGKYFFSTKVHNIPSRLVTVKIIWQLLFNKIKIQQIYKYKSCNKNFYRGF